MDQKAEKSRLKALDRYDILDTAPEENFDRITRIAQTVLNIPIALVSLVDEKRQWFKSCQGLSVRETAREDSFCTIAIQNDEPLIVQDATKDPRFKKNPYVIGDPNIRFYAGIPLRTPAGYNVGTLCVIDTVPRRLSQSELQILRDLARIIVDEMELRYLATVDCLTGLLRRKSFQASAEHALQQSLRTGADLSIVVFDLDHFKAINDQFGHAVGDRVLQEVATICRSSLRKNDVAARLGGEEFVVLLPQTNLSEALEITESLRALIDAKILKDSGKTIRFTASFGVANYLNCGEDDIRTILNCADDHLYQAKANGRNCIMPQSPSLRVIEQKAKAC